MRGIVLLAALALAVPALAQGFLVVPDATTDRIMTFDPFDGSLINADFIPDAGGGTYDFQTPKDAILVGSEIWVSDQISDAVYRFSLTGSYLATVSGGLDNIRGMAYANGRVYVSNNGTGNGAPGEAIVMYAPDGTPLGNFANCGDPFDVFEYQGNLLISDIDNDDIRKHAYDGTFMEIFHNSDGTGGVDFPQQLSLKGSNGNVLLAGFSSPIALFEYDDKGAEVGRIEEGNGNRGVYELGNGKIMWTDGAGVHIYDPFSGGTEDVITGVSAQYINLVPEPASLLLLAFVALVRRR